MVGGGGGGLEGGFWEKYGCTSGLKAFERRVVEVVDGGGNVLIKIDAAVGEFAEGSLLLEFCSRCPGQHSLFHYFSCITF